MIKKRGRNMPAGAVGRGRKSGSTVTVSTASAAPSATRRLRNHARRPSVSRVRENRTHGLRGGWGNGTARGTAPLTTNDESGWLDEREARVWQAYRDVVRDLQSAFDRQLADDAGLSGADFALLAPLSESPEGVLRTRDLGLMVGWGRSRISHQVSRMQKRGLVVLKTVPTTHADRWCG